MSGSAAQESDGADGGPTPANWYALSALTLATLAAFLALPFFPGAILCSVVAGFLGERGIMFARERPGRPGRVLAYWAIGLCTASFAIAFVIALQAQAVLSDPALMEEALQQTRASETSS